MQSVTKKFELFKARLKCKKLGKKRVSFARPSVPTSFVQEFSKKILDVRIG